MECDNTICPRASGAVVCGAPRVFAQGFVPAAIPAKFDLPPRRQGQWAGSKVKAPSAEGWP